MYSLATLMGTHMPMLSMLVEEKKLLVHAYRHPLLRDFLRVSVGSRAAMERFLKLFYEAESEA